MSDLMPSTDALECRPGPALAPVLESYPAREADLGGGLVVRRLLPRSGRRLVGPWGFFGHFGPLGFGVGKPLDVGPHPHIGLQTVTGLLACRRTGRRAQRGAFAGDDLFEDGGRGGCSRPR